MLNSKKLICVKRQAKNISASLKRANSGSSHVHRTFRDFLCEKVKFGCMSGETELFCFVKLHLLPHLLCL